MSGNTKLKMKKMTVSPIHLTKTLTILACCDKVEITSGATYVMFGKHQFDVTVVYCKACGEVKATSNIKGK